MKRAKLQIEKGHSYPCEMTISHLALCVFGCLVLVHLVCCQKEEQHQQLVKAQYSRKGKAHKRCMEETKGRTMTELAQQLLLQFKMGEGHTCVQGGDEERINTFPAWINLNIFFPFPVKRSKIQVQSSYPLPPLRG